MCGRFTLQTSPQQFAQLFEGISFPQFTARYNIAPTQTVQTIRINSDNEHVAPMMRWGLIPTWAKDMKIGARMINARGETVATKPSFRSAFKRRRCLIAADGFYEWKKEGKEKQPYYITRADDSVFMMAGLWEKWTEKIDGKPTPNSVYSCTIITTEANSTMSPLHDRMPVILNRESYAMWMDPTFEDRDTLEALLVSCPDDELKTVAVSKTVNKATNEIPECVVPLS